MFKKIKITISRRLSTSSRQYLRRFIKPLWLSKIKDPLSPISDYCGFERGRPLDRYYIDKFIKENQSSIKGFILEFLEPEYASVYAEPTSKIETMDIDITNKSATIIGDIRNAYNIQSSYFDCIIATQLLQFIDDLDASLSELIRILKPGGVMLISVPSVSRIDPIAGVDGDYWRFTCSSLTYLLTKHKDVTFTINSAGNLYAIGISLLGGTVEDANVAKLSYNDQNFPLVIFAKVSKKNA